MGLCAYLWVAPLLMCSPFTYIDVIPTCQNGVVGMRVREKQILIRAKCVVAFLVQTHGQKGLRCLWSLHVTIVILYKRGSTPTF